jgi:ABC-2 type transport system ATP-binding protein
VLILDEPTSGLDPNQLADIRHLIRELGQEKTVLFSTHIMQEVEALCHRVVIIDKGRIVADDSIEQLQGRLAGDAVVTVEFSTAVQIELLRRIPGVKSVEHLGPNQRYRLVAPKGTDVRVGVYQFSAAHHAPLLEMHREEQSIEDIFQQLTKGTAAQKR